jgi:hypothetical protein
MSRTFPRRFNEDTGLKVRMIQAWLILIGKARNRQTITYGDLAKLMTGGVKSSLGKRAGQWKGMRLGSLYAYCEERGLPILPVIVVTKKTGLPADLAPYRPNERHGPEPNAEREKVFDYDWFGIHPPCEGDLHN